jgi:2-octaprenylphenol hydroxylase
LPLRGGDCSIVWSVPAARARELLLQPESEFSQALTVASDQVLGRLTLVSGRAGFPLHRMSARHYVLERCALVGDAAHVVHPLAGQGVNLGLLDAAALADVLGRSLSEHEDPGALRILRAYERWRRSENEIMSRAFDVFNRLLSTGSDPLSKLAQRGMGMVSRSDLLRRLFMGRALGTTGDLPAAAQTRVMS